MIISVVKDNMKSQIKNLHLLGSLLLATVQGGLVENKLDMMARNLRAYSFMTGATVQELGLFQSEMKMFLLEKYLALISNAVDVPTPPPGGYVYLYTYNNVVLNEFQSGTYVDDKTYQL